MLNHQGVRGSTHVCGSACCYRVSPRCSVVFEYVIFLTECYITSHRSHLALDPRVIATGFENDGQDTPEAGQVPSLTSSNNFINFCLTVPNLPITNGKEIKTGSCNPAPMGIIAATTNMPSAKFVTPTNGLIIPADTAFDIQLAISHLHTGNFANDATNLYAAPQQVDSAGDILGHTAIVIEFLSSLTDTQPTNPAEFAFFKDLNLPAQNGVLSASVTAGLPAGAYRLASINFAANHQPVLVAVAQHGSLDDMIYVSDFSIAAVLAQGARLTLGVQFQVVANSTGNNAAAPPKSKAPPKNGKGGKGGRAQTRRAFEVKKSRLG